MLVKRFFARKISVSWGPCNIHFCFFLLLIALLFYLHIVIIARRPLNLAILIALLFIQSIICLLVFYSHMNTISFLYSCSLIVQNLIHVYQLQKMSSYVRYVLPLVILYNHFYFFIPPCVLKLPPNVSFVPPFRLLFNFKMADFYVIIISKIRTNRWSSGNNLLYKGIKEK